MATGKQLAEFNERTRRFLELGHDRFAAAGFVAGLAGNLEAPVLDVGTGKGLLAMALAERCQEVVSLDVNAEDIELARLLASERNLSERIRLIIQDASALPFPDDSFGAAAMMHVLHHLHNGEAVLREMARVLKPGGKMIVADFNETGFALVAKIHEGEGRVHPRSSSDLDSAASFLRSLGVKEMGRKSDHNTVAAWFVKAL